MSCQKWITSKIKAADPFVPNILWQSFQHDIIGQLKAGNINGITKCSHGYFCLSLYPEQVQSQYAITQHLAIIRSLSQCTKKLKCCDISGVQIVIF